MINRVSCLFSIALFSFHSIYLVVCVCECRDFVDFPLDISKHITKFDLSLISRRSSTEYSMLPGGSVTSCEGSAPYRFRVVARRFRGLLICCKFYLLIIFRNAYSPLSRRYQGPFSTTIY
jgi:hypothetical protein